MTDKLANGGLVNAGWVYDANGDGCAFLPLKPERISTDRITRIEVNVGNGFIDVTHLFAGVQND